MHAIQRPGIFMHGLFVLGALASPNSVLAQVTDPRITYWVFNLDGHHGHSTNATINATVSTIFADVYPAQMRYTSNNVYLQATGIPTYDVGPFPDGNPNIPGNQNRLFRIPRSPQPAGVPTNTGLGAIGVWVNGVVMFNAKDARSYNNLGFWNQNAVFVEADGFDSALGHPAMGGLYHHHQRPIALLTQLGDRPGVHSPLIGYAFDGFPIYGPYAYANTDGTGGITRIRSSYRLRNITVRQTSPDGTPLLENQYGPAVAPPYVLGYYIEDFEYVAGLGDLDAHNGRTCVTPEFPGGTYTYFTTTNQDDTSAYPYAVGPQYYGVVATDTVTRTVTVPGGASTFTATSAIPCISIWSQPVSTNSDAGSAATFTVSLRYGPNATFQWRKSALPLSDGGQISGVTTASLSISSLSPANAGIYDCVITGECGNLTSSVATLTVIVDIPSVSSLGLMILAVALFAAGACILQRRHRCGTLC